MTIRTSLASCGARPGRILLWCWLPSVIFALLPRFLLAQDELTAVPNRPSVSTPAQPVQPGVLETEWGVNAAAAHQDLNALLKFGVSKNFELRLANNPFTADTGTYGFGDTSMGFKYRFTPDSGHRPALGFIYMLKLPTAGNVLGSGQTDHSLVLLVSKDIGKHHLDFISSPIYLGDGGVDSIRHT